MNPIANMHSPQEIELKLALPTADPSVLAKRLARTPLLARRKPTQRHLHNVYYDTPECSLRQARAALRLRRVGSEGEPQWLQTLKMGGTAGSALSQRGEWESAVPAAVLDLGALAATPWTQIDPDGSVFRRLVPSFATDFERTSWLVRRRDGSVVEVALDIGQITAAQRTVPICELELELLAGSPAALFDIARQLSATTAMVPCAASKAERGYALLEGTLERPVVAQPPTLTPGLALADAGRRVLREMFNQFTANLMALSTSEDPEVVHQARIGWRRLRSAARLFKAAFGADPPPPCQALGPLLEALGELRDLDVASTQTLPALAGAYASGDAARERAWQGFVATVARAAGMQRQAARTALEQPAVGATLIAGTQWLEGVPVPGATAGTLRQPPEEVHLRRWARQRLRRMRRKLRAASKCADDVESRHRIRILAKRMRYAVEVLGALLPERRARRWHEQATHMQASIGAARDVVQAGAIASRFCADPEIVAFLRGVAAGLAQRG